MITNTSIEQTDEPPISTWNVGGTERMVKMVKFRYLLFFFGPDTPS